MRTELHVLLALGALCAAGCDASEGGNGTLAIRISGEEAALGGYPVGEGEDQIAFTDGWTLEFQKVIVSISHFHLATEDGEEADLDVDPIVVDLHQGAPELWRFEGIAAQRWDQVDYRYSKPTGDARSVNDVSEADFELMRDNSYSLLIEAIARKDEQEVPLQFGFPLAIDVMHCENGLDGTDGIVVRDNAVTNAEITVHLDHLFFDSYATEEANLRFDAMAAMYDRAPSSGPLLLAALKGQDNLSDMKGPDGEPLDLSYDPGSAFHPVPKNLEEYVNAAAETTGHWNGEGHCEYHRL
jgi:hypothetical protein